MAEFEKQKYQLVGKTLYNGRKINGSSNIVFVLAGYAEESAITYLKRLQDYITGRGINVRFIHKQIASKRSTGKNEKNYSLWDSYVNADIITYPSLVEGWGNQFIEAVFAEKPIVLFEYPVFKYDIKQERYFYISLGDKVINNENHKELIQVEKNVLNKAVSEAMEILTASDTEEKLHQNFIIGKEYHGYHRLSDFLKKAVEKNLQIP